MSLFVAVIAADSAAQTAGSTVVSVSTSELREVAKGWSGATKDALKAAPKFEYAK